MKMNRIPWKRVRWMRRASCSLLLIGAVLSAVGYAVFQVPYNIAAGGVSGIAILVNHFTGWPVSTFYLSANLPLFVLGYLFLGALALFMEHGAGGAHLFGGDAVAGGQPAAISSRQLPDHRQRAAERHLGGPCRRHRRRPRLLAGSTMGGTAIVGRIIQVKTGLSLSQIYLFVDGTIVLAAGILFGWETALYAMLTLLLSGIATDYVLEGPSPARAQPPSSPAIRSRSSTPSWPS